MLSVTTNTNRLDTSNTSFVNSTQASGFCLSSDPSVLSTDNLFTAKSSSITSVPDLIVENATNPGRAIAGNKIKLSYTEKNIGTIGAGRHDVGFYLSRDDKYDSSDIEIDTNSYDTVENLDAGASITRTKEFTLDKNIAPGDYFVLYFADDFSILNESNQTNNIFAQRITINPPSPDLIVENGVAPDTATAGQNIDLSYKEVNIGIADAPEHKVGFYLSKDAQWDSNDIKLGEDSVQNLYGDGYYVNRTKTFTLDSNLISGDYFVLYVSDSNSNLNESNEFNNTFAKKITIQGKPCQKSFNDLELGTNSTFSVPIDEKNQDSIEAEKFNVTDASPDLLLEVEDDKSPKRAKAGSEIKLSYKEKNIGSADAQEHRVGFYLSKDDKFDPSDIKLGEDSVRRVRSGKYITHTKKFTLDSNIASGDYYLIYVGDDNNQVNESDENNNIIAKPITIKGKVPGQSLNDVEPLVESTSSGIIDEKNQDLIEVENYSANSL